MKTTKHWLTTIAVLLYSVSVSAHWFEVDGIYYEYTTGGVYVTYSGNSYSEVADEYRGDVVIPEVVKYNNYEYKVISIGGNAFRDCKNLTSVIIGDNVAEIYTDAFRNCTSLTSVSVGKNVYSADAFYASNAITTVHFNCKNVGTWFTNKSALTNITLGDNVESVSESSFTGTGWYNSQPDGLLYLDDWLLGYKGSRPVGEVNIAEGTKYVQDGALYNCSGITSVNVPSSIVKIGDKFLASCTALQQITIDENNSKYDSRDNCNAIIETSSNEIIQACANTTIPSTAMSIGDYAFCQISGLINIEIPNNITSIGEEAFYECENLESVVIGNNVKSIGPSAFSYCSNLVNLKLGDNVEELGNYSFSSCKNLTNLHMGESLKTIGEGAFQYCNMLNEISIPNSVTRIKENAFYGTGWYNSQSGESYILDGWVLSDTNNPAYTLKDGIRGIADRVYSGRDALYIGTLKIPNTVVGIGEYAFSRCRGLYEVVMPNSVKEISNGAFYYSGITSIAIPNSVSRINGCFMSCDNLVEVVIPNSITWIDASSFNLCSRIQRLYVLAETPPVIDNSGVYDYSSLYVNATLYVPKGTKSAYQSNSAWGNFENIVEIDTEYNVTYMVDDEELATETLTIGTIIERVEVPQKEGYSFSWGSAYPSTMPARDITITGTYTKKSYTITYIVDGATYATNRLEYDALIEPIVAPEKDGYIFVGWSSLPETMPAKDVTVEAIYQEKPTTVTITLGKYGSGTYCSEYALDFSEVKGLKAYAATGYNSNTGVVTLTRVMTAKSGEGLFLKGEQGSYVIPILATSNDNTLNMLVGTLESTSVDAVSEDGLYANYKYTIIEGEIAPLFYQFADGSTLSAGKAYLQIPVAWLSSMEAKSISYRFDDGETTDMEDVEFETAKDVYDLMGRRVENPIKGMYIVNGKKIMFNK